MFMSEDSVRNKHILVASLARVVRVGADWAHNAFQCMARGLAFVSSSFV